MIWRVKNGRFQMAVKVEELGKIPYHQGEKLVKCLVQLAKTSEDAESRWTLEDVPAMFQNAIDKAQARLHTTVEHRPQLRRLIKLQEFFQQEYEKK